MFHDDYVNLCEDITPNFGDKNNWYHDNTLYHTSFLTREFLTKNNVILYPIHPTFLFPQLKIKLKGRHFNTTEVIETESQGTVNMC
jgi:hypothetical protein